MEKAGVTERKQEKGTGQSVCIREEQAWENGEKGEERDQPHVSKLLVSMLGWLSLNHCSLGHLLNCSPSFCGGLCLKD